jgi:tetratricopeptide (TPR) repeat protein
MKRTGYLGVTLLLLIALVVSALPGFGQDKPKQAKTTAEYNAYVALIGEKDPAKKAGLGEKFIAEFKESDYIPEAHQMIIGAYSGAKNFPKVIEAAERGVAVPNVPATLKAFAYANAMLAAQSMNDVDKTISYGEKVLAIQPDDPNTMITLSAMYLAKLPTDEAAKKVSLDKAEGLATKALTTIQGMAAKASPQDKPQLVQIEGNLYATRGLVAYNRQDYNKSIQEYEQSLQRTPKDDVAHFYMALDYQTLAAQASRQYAAAVDEENKAKKERAEQPVIDELSAKSEGLAGDVRKFRDKAIDELAITVALGGPVAAQAKTTLTQMWMAKFDNTTELEAFIAEKKKELK